jgi:uncharacterized membrane protein (DUF4010 family)
MVLLLLLAALEGQRRGEEEADRRAATGAIGSCYTSVSAMPDLNPLVLGFLVALGIGLLIGIDRERNKGDGPSREAAGLRTFTLAALAGAIGMAAGSELLLGAAVLGVVALTGLAYWRARDGDPGLTTEVALVLTTLLGGFAIREPAVAAGLGVVVAALLNARSTLHRISRSVLSDVELKDLLIFAGATLVVLPLLPDEPVGPYGALNLRNVWIVVILVMAVSALGYVAMRIVGTRFGLPLAGLASGFISSTATIAAMGGHAAGAVLSTVATIVQLVVVLAATSPATLEAFWIPLAAAGVAALAYGGLFTLSALKQKGNGPKQADGAFSLKTALAFAATLAVILVVSAALQNWFGETGILLAAAAAGLADTHAAAISVASLVAAGKMDAAHAVFPILAGMTTNTVTKIIMAFTNGDRAFVMRVVPGLVLVIAAAWAGALVEMGR